MMNILIKDMKFFLIYFKEKKIRQLKKKEMKLNVYHIIKKK